MYLHLNFAFLRESSPCFFYLVSISISKEITSINSVIKCLLSWLSCISLFHYSVFKIILFSYHFIVLGTSRFSKISHNTLRMFSHSDGFEIKSWQTLLNSALGLHFLSMYLWLHAYVFTDVCTHVWAVNILHRVCIFLVLSFPVLF